MGCAAAGNFVTRPFANSSGSSRRFLGFFSTVSPRVSNSWTSDTEFGRSLKDISEGSISKRSCTDPSKHNAQVKITVSFEDPDPQGRVAAGHAHKTFAVQRFSDPPIPRGTPYASLIEADVPIVVQHTRPALRNPSIALLSTIAFPAADD